MPRRLIVFVSLSVHEQFTRIFLIFFHFLILVSIFTAEVHFKLYGERSEKQIFNLKQKTLWQRKRRKLRRSQLRSLQRKQARRLQRKARKKARRKQERERSNAPITDHSWSGCFDKKPEYCVLRFFYVLFRSRCIGRSRFCRYVEAWQFPVCALKIFGPGGVGAGTLSRLTGCRSMLSMIGLLFPSMPGQGQCHDAAPLSRSKARCQMEFVIQRYSSSIGEPEGVLFRREGRYYRRVACMLPGECRDKE